ncbi:MAG TPA: hypothetical protein VMV42_00195 [archaeon]|nr:hypothetical protein [archaeon]
MFWESVLGGLAALSHWQMWLASVEYLAIYIVPTYLVGFASGAAAEERQHPMSGCLMMLVGPLLQCAATIIFLWTIGPILLGASDKAAWTFPWQFMAANPWPFTKMCLTLLVAAFLASFTPILGRSQTLQTLVLGIITLIFLSWGLRSFFHIQNHFEVFPGFWFVLGLLVIGGILAWLGTLLGTLLVALIDQKQSGLGILAMLPISALLGFIPVFMYASWLGTQLKAAVGS